MRPSVIEPAGPFPHSVPLAALPSRVPEHDLVTRIRCESERFGVACDLHWVDCAHFESHVREVDRRLREPPRGTAV